MLAVLVSCITFHAHCAAAVWFRNQGGSTVLQPPCLVLQASFSKPTHHESSPGLPSRLLVKGEKKQNTTSLSAPYGATPNDAIPR